MAQRGKGGPGGDGCSFRYDNGQRCGSKDLGRNASNASGFHSWCKAHIAADQSLRRAKYREGNGTAVPASRTALTDDALRDAVRLLLSVKTKKGHAPWTLESLSDHFDCGPSRVRDALSQLTDQHFNVVQLAGGVVTIDRELQQREPTVIPLDSLKGKPFKHGLTADNHLCSKYQRLDVLNALFDWWADQGVTTVYQLGNMVDGETHFNRHDLIVHGLEGQLDYFCEHWPQRKGITTYYITGDDHEGWWTQRDGTNVGERLEDKARKGGRTDLVYLGHMEHDLILQTGSGQAVVRLTHPGGGSSYATSYQVQKIVESYPPGEKPDVLYLGHYHKTGVFFPRGVRCVLAGSTEDQTPFMRKKRLASELGGWTIEFTQSDDGLLHAFKPAWEGAYNEDYYRDEQWQYRWRQRGGGKAA